MGQHRGRCGTFTFTLCKSEHLWRSYGLKTIFIFLILTFAGKIVLGQSRLTLTTQACEQTLPPSNRTLYYASACLIVNIGVVKLF